MLPSCIVMAMQATAVRRRSVKRQKPKPKPKLTRRWKISRSSVTIYIIDYMIHCLSLLPPKWDVW